MNIMDNELWRKVSTEIYSVHCLATDDYECLPPDSFSSSIDKRHKLMDKYYEQAMKHLRLAYAYTKKMDEYAF